MLIINIITPFPSMFNILFNHSILNKAKTKNKVKYNIYDLFDYLDSPNHRIDDYPFGGNEGMILKPEPIYNVLKKINKGLNKKKHRVIFPSPDGDLFNHDIAKKMSEQNELTFICGHYKGIDQRIRDEFVNDEISIGDFVLTSGELPSMIIIDAIVRLKEGVLNNYISAKKDSFYEMLLDGPHYTRPRNFKGLMVPKILLSGNHKIIEEWFLKKRENKTKKRRIDLWNKYKSIKEDGA